ncbi:hypothetical protein CHS0354_031199 [Potamilus streckersoni]|uniref:HTH psq-type domain-containing protein n=1 Tax=Potamilus streckersoni TaxID=2493646 RepID=A0AAE0TKL0_9BIVA|nr:hypothetical protein CHS0354_031199 [Potamilus streckersoni]
MWPTIGVAMPKRYTTEELKYAVSSVKQKRLTITQAYREFKVPRKTVEDHVKGKVQEKAPGRSPILTTNEESSMVNYMKYSAQQGFPLTRKIARQYVITIMKQNGRQSLFNMNKGPSD